MWKLKWCLLEKTISPQDPFSGFTGAFGHISGFIPRGQKSLQSARGKNGNLNITIHWQLGSDTSVFLEGKTVLTQTWYHLGFKLEMRLKPESESKSCSSVRQHWGLKCPSSWRRRLIGSWRLSTWNWCELDPAVGSCQSVNNHCQCTPKLTQGLSSPSFLQDEVMQKLLSWGLQ